MPRSEQLEELLKSDPEDAFANYALGLAYVSEGRTADGLERLQQVIDRHPDYVAAYFQKGQVLASTGETKKAQDVLAVGIEVAHKVGETHAEAEMGEFLRSL